MLETITKYTPSEKTAESAPGFAERLRKLLCVSGIRPHGRLATLGMLSGLQPATMRTRMKDDKPPLKKKHFEAMVEGVVELCDHAGHKVNVKTVTEYLLNDVPLSAALLKKMEKAYAEELQEIKEKEEAEEPDFTPLANPGFTDRLDTTLLYAGIKNGKLAKLSRWLGKTLGGIKYIYEHDKPFKKRADHDKLVDHLHKSITLFTGKEITPEKISDYLLIGKPDIFRKFDGPENFYKEDIKDYFDSVVLGECYIFIISVGDKLGVKIFEELPRNKLKKVIDRSLFIIRRASGKRDEATADAIAEVIKKAADGTL